MNIQEQLRKSIARLMSDRHFTREALGDIIGVDASHAGRILNEKGNFTLEHIEKIAEYCGFRAIDVFTYPDFYEKPGPREQEPAEVLLQLRLTKEKKDQVLKLVFGENNIEILNR